MGSRGPASKKGTSLKFTPGVPDAPEWLDEVAREEYARVSAEMEKAGRDYLQQVDLSDLLTYAQGYSDVARLTVKVRETGETLQSARGGFYPNPDNNALQMAYNRMKAAAGRLGFSPSDRNRIGSKATGKQRDDPLSNFV